MTKGGHRMNDILHVLPVDVPPLPLGEVVLTTWNDSAVTSLEDAVAGDPPAFDALLRLAGARTYTEYVRGTRHVVVGKWWGLGQNLYHPRGPLHITPYENLGPKEGFAAIKDAVIEIEMEEATSQRVGVAVLLTLSVAR